MQICKRCLYTSQHPLNLTFDEEGICSGCRVHEEKDVLDWADRGEKLRSILDSYRNLSGNNYDCIIPVSGARDSYFIVHVVKNIYGMNPLLVTYNKHYNTATGIRNLANLRIRFDCDIMTLTVNPEIVKKITRSTLRRFGSMYWHCIAGQTVFPVQMATKLKIPLIVWGAHQGVDQVGMFSHLDEVEMTRKYRKEHDLMGFEAEDLIDDFDNITENDILSFCYPENEVLERVGVRGIYLNNYVRWNSRKQHEQMIHLYNYETLDQDRTFDTYHDADCWNYLDVHDYIKFLKHGYGKVTDHACREIRLRQMTRFEAVNLVKSHQCRRPKNLPHFLSWLGITENSFHYIVDQHRNKLFWERDPNWDWAPTDIFREMQDAIFAPTDSPPQQELFREFQLTGPGRSTDHNGRYILIGKGHM
jgi:N-acetyl sugar amidotransferase